MLLRIHSKSSRFVQVLYYYVWYILFRINCWYNTGKNTQIIIALNLQKWSENEPLFGTTISSFSWNVVDDNTSIRKFLKTYLNLIFSTKFFEKSGLFWIFSGILYKLSFIMPRMSANKVSKSSSIFLENILWKTFKMNTNFWIKNMKNQFLLTNVKR